jgi:hypothetical protein
MQRGCAGSTDLTRRLKFHRIPGGCAGSRHIYEFADFQGEVVQPDAALVRQAYKNKLIFGAKTMTQNGW